MSGLELRAFRELFTSYTELRLQENRNIHIAFVRGNNTANSRAHNGGVCARVYQAGSWGLASSPDVSAEAIASVVKTATANAAFLDAKTAKGRGSLPLTRAEAHHDFATKRPRLGQKELVQFAREVDSHIAAQYPLLSSRTVSLSCLDIEKTLLTSDGSYSYSMTPRSQIHVAMSIHRDGRPVDLGKTYGGLGQFEDVFESPAVLLAGLEEQYQHLARKAEGVFADAGVRTCVLDAELAGILAHEAIGHTTEADLVMGGSVAGALVGKEAASPLVTLVDFAHTCAGTICPVPVYVDDEGTPAEDAVLIDQGVLKGFLHNKESALHFGVAPTGNARAFTFSDEPLIRMRNTAILPGTSKLADMIASVDDGYYLVRPSNGQADSTSEFMFGITLGYEIRNGKLGRAIRDTTIAGVAFEVLKTVSMVSDEMRWMSGGMCGKKQPIPVGMGGPAIKCRISIGGR